MKKVSSAVWRFFERIEENKRCVAVVCKLCESQYKYFGNTTNLRVHLINKHPIQWELSESGTLDESSFPITDTSANTSTLKRKKFRTRTRPDKNVGYSISIDNKEDATEGAMPKIEIQRIDVLQNSDSDNDDDTLNLVRQMHGEQNSGEEWLEEEPFIETYQSKPKRRKMKFRKIKREIPSPTGLPGYYVAPKADNIVYEDTNRQDEYTVFGDYIANKIRKLKTPRTRGNLQQLITTILWQAEYGMYDNADSVKRVLMLSVAEPEQTVQTEYITQEHNIQTEVVEQREDINQSSES